MQLDRFWNDKLPPSRKGTAWDQVLFVLVAYRLLSPGSEWRLHREWFDKSALADLLGSDESLSEIGTLYRCHDRLLAHKPALFEHLVGRWRDLFNASFEVLLYDLTSTYFEADPPFPEGDKRRHGYSRDHRPDCVQVIIALVITPEGLPLAYEVLPGNTSDRTTLRGFLDCIERQYGKAKRIWLMDRGVPTEETLGDMRASDPPVQYLVGTPKGRLTKLERDLVDKPWREAREGVQVKLLPMDGELYVFAESKDRVAKERAMRKRQLKWLWARLKQLTTMKLSRQELLMKLGAARERAHTAWRLVMIDIDPRQATFSFSLDRNKLRQVRRREGRYLLRTNLFDDDPARLWSYYLQLVRIEEAFKNSHGRSRHPPHLPSARDTRRSAHLHCLPRLLSACHPGKTAGRARPRPHPKKRIGEVRRPAADRHRDSNHQRARNKADTALRARSRTQAPPRQAQARIASPALAQNHRRSHPRQPSPVVKTFDGRLSGFQGLSLSVCSNRRSSAGLPRHENVKEEG